MTDRELMHQALDALEVMRPACFAETTLKKADTAITALRDRLAQPEQELVFDCPRCGHCCSQPEQEPLEYWNAVEGWVKIDEVREHFDSVGCGTIYKTEGEDRTPLYTTPPQRPWVGLTDEEIGMPTEPIQPHEAIMFARVIEALIKEKNK